MEHIQKKNILNNNIDRIYYVIVCENPSLQLSPSKNQLVSCYCKQGSVYLIFKIQQVRNRWNSPNVLISSSSNKVQATVVDYRTGWIIILPEFTLPTEQKEISTNAFNGGWL